MGCSSTGGMWGSPKHPDLAGPQPHGCMWLCDGCGVGPSPTLSLRSVPGHAAPSPSKDNEEWQKNESNNKSRLGPPCCQHLNQGREQPVPPFQLGTVGWGRNGERKQNPKHSFQTIAFYSMYRAQRAEHPRTAALGAGCDTDTHNRDRWPPCPPAGQRERRGGEQGRPGRCGAEVECRPGESRSGAGGRGPESPCPRSWGAARSGDHLPPGPGAPSPGTRLERDRHGPTCLWQNLSVLVPHCALPAAWGSCPKSKRWMKRGTTAPHSRMCCLRVWGALAMVVGQRKGRDLQSCSSETKAKATGRSGPCTAWGDPGSLCPAAPSPHRQRLLCWSQELPQPHSGHRPCVGRSGTELWVLWGAGPDEGLGEPHSCLWPGCHPPAQLAPAPRHLPRLREPVLASFPETVATQRAQPRVPSPCLPLVLS